MKTTKKAIIDMVVQLNDLIELRRAQDKVERELKAVLKEFMGSDFMLEAGDLVVIIDPRTRTDLDRKALTIELGSEKIKKFTKSTTYDVVTVRRIREYGDD